MSAELFSVSGIVFVHQEKAIGAKVTLQQHLYLNMNFTEIKLILNLLKATKPT